MNFSHSHIYYRPPQNPKKVTWAKPGAPTGYKCKRGHPAFCTWTSGYRSGTRLHVQPVGPKLGLEQSNSFQLQPQWARVRWQVFRLCQCWLERQGQAPPDIAGRGWVLLLPSRVCCLEREGAHPARTAPVPLTLAAPHALGHSRGTLSPKAITGRGTHVQMEQNDPACLARERGGCLLSQHISFCLLCLARHVRCTGSHTAHRVPVRTHPRVL